MVAFVSELPSGHIQKKDDCLSAIVHQKIFVAERQGFEPWIPEGITVFETAPIDHSGISPYVSRRVFHLFERAKINKKT